VPGGTAEMAAVLAPEETLNRLDRAVERLS
jgi:hypothetical protein